jgi:hypothetical protein
MAGIEKFTSEITYSKKSNADPIASTKNNTDALAPEFKLYLEGVQIPFESISITQVYNGRPSAQIQVPPQSGLLDILRGYEPKVHVFYRDDNYGGDRLLFWGIVKGSTYSRSRSQGSTYIVFHCEHKNSVIDNITLDFTGWASSVSSSLTDPNQNSANLKAPAFNSTQMIIQAMAGVNGLAYNFDRIVESNSRVADANPALLDASFVKIERRFDGMPGVMVNLWNQAKKASYREKLNNPMMVKMSIPLVEEGIGYFKRMSGHPTLETKIQNSKQPYCNRIGGEEVKVIVPPYFRSSMISAVQAEISVSSISNQAQFSGELTTLEGMMRSLLYDGCRYDMLTLASPAEINANPEIYIDRVEEQGVEKSTIETIIKPQMPLYYSPTCNVLLPRMYSAISIQQSESSIPTRVSSAHEAMPVSTGPNSLSTSFKAPASFREAVAYNSYVTKPTATRELDIKATLGNSFHIPGKYEQGCGVRHEKIALPWWLAILATDRSSRGKGLNEEVMPSKGTPEYDDMIIMSAEWKKRHGVDIIEEDSSFTVKDNVLKHKLNPYDPLNETIQPHERVLISTLDYEYTVRAASSKNGSVSGIFNPYVIPGYPIDIIDDSPNHPSFHAFCVAVTHTITSRSVATDISITNAVTYAELSNYYSPPVSPYLQTALKIVNGEINREMYNSKPIGDTSCVTKTSSVLIQNPEAKAVADRFYREVLGVGAAAPDDLIHFASNRAYPVQRKAGILLPMALAGNDAPPSMKPDPRGYKQEVDYFSSVGNLRLVSRPIESKNSISEKFKYKFIDITPVMYNQSSVNYLNPKLASNFFLEPGASLFLDYMETQEFIKI